MKKKKTINKRKMKINKVHITLFFIVLIGLFLSFFYGYILGLFHEHSTLTSKFLPSFVVSRMEKSTDILKDTFSIKVNFNDEKLSLNNTISYPHGWYFDEVKTDLENEDILTPKKYVVSNSNEKVKLYITPVSINNFRSVMSASTETVVTVLSDEEVQRRCLGSYDISESDKFEMISLYREDIGENEIKYVQEVLPSVVNSGEETNVLDEFVVFKRDGGFIEGSEVVWIADITLNIDESITGKERDEYLKIIDEIVASLKIE